MEGEKESEGEREGAKRKGERGELQMRGMGWGEY